MRLRLVAALAAVVFAITLSSCGSRGAAPVSPREARFDVNPGLTDRTFQVVELRAENAAHTFAPPVNCSAPNPLEFTAPYRFYLENALGPVEGIFQPASADSLSDVQLLFGGDTVPVRVDDPSGNSAGCPVFSQDPQPFCLNSGGVPDAVTALAPEVRFDVSASSTGVFFSSTIGDTSGSHIVNPAPAPATFFLENATGSVTGVFTKVDSSVELTARLFINGCQVRSATSPANTITDVVLAFEF